MIEIPILRRAKTELGRSQLRLIRRPIRGHGICASIYRKFENIHFFLITQDNRNQVITTNVWVRQVRHLNLSSSVKLSKKVNISRVCFEFKTRLAQQRFSQGPSVFTKQTALLCNKFESILLLKRALIL